MLSAFAWENVFGSLALAFYANTFDESTTAVHTQQSTEWIRIIFVFFSISKNRIRTDCHWYKEHYTKFKCGNASGVSYWNTFFYFEINCRHFILLYSYVFLPKKKIDSSTWSDRDYRIWIKNFWRKIKPK